MSTHAQGNGVPGTDAAACMADDELVATGFDLPVVIAKQPCSHQFIIRYSCRDSRNRVDKKQREQSADGA